MELQDQNNNEEKTSAEIQGKAVNYWKWIAFGFIGLLIFTQIFDVDISVKPRFGSGRNQAANIAQDQNDSKLEEAVLPDGGVTLPIRWNDLGKQMVEAGVIDRGKFESIYNQRGGLDEDAKNLLYGNDNGAL